MPLGPDRLRRWFSACMQAIMGSACLIESEGPPPEACIVFRKCINALSSKSSVMPRGPVSIGQSPSPDVRYVKCRGHAHASWQSVCWASHGPQVSSFWDIEVSHRCHQQLPQLLGGTQHSLDLLQGAWCLTSSRPGGGRGGGGNGCLVVSWQSKGVSLPQVKTTHPEIYK